MAPSITVFGLAIGVAETCAPTLTAAAKRSGTQKSTRMVDRSSMVAIAVSDGHIVADLDREDADDAVDRRDDGAALQREFRVAQGELCIAQRDLGVGQRRLPWRCWRRAAT